jgi:uncharacterized protein YaaR (DUF327 family)
MKRILKYKLNLDSDNQYIDLPKGSKILKVQVLESHLENELYMWALVPDNEEIKITETIEEIKGE